VTANKY